MGCAQSTAAAPQVVGQQRRAAAAAAGPESAINNFCNMAGVPQEVPRVGARPVLLDNDASTVIWRAEEMNGQGIGGKDAAMLQSMIVKPSLCCAAGSSTTTVLALPPSTYAAQEQHFRTESRSTEDHRSTQSGSSISTNSSKAGMDAFPERLTSLDLAATNFRASDFSFDIAADSEELSGWSLKTSTLGFAAHRFLLPQLQESEKGDIKGRISPPHHITLSDEELCNLGIVRDARHFVFSYPIVTAQELNVSAKEGRVADIAFLVYGGYMYFDSDMVLRDVRAVVPTDEGGLCFGPPQQWLPEWSLAAGADRWCPVTLPSLRALGVRYFSWLLPGETVDGSTLCTNGGFAYIFHEPAETGVLQARLDIFFQLVDKEVDEGKGCPQCSRLLEWSDYDQGVYAGGWTCEFASGCGQSRTSEAPMRWFCPQCQLDICDACYSGLQTEGKARRLLHSVCKNVADAA